MTIYKDVVTGRREGKVWWTCSIVERETFDVKLASLRWRKPAQPSIFFFVHFHIIIYVPHFIKKKKKPAWVITEHTYLIKPGD